MDNLGCLWLDGGSAPNYKGDSGEGHDHQYHHQSAVDLAAAGHRSYCLSGARGKLYERVEEIEREAARKGLFGEDAEGYQLSRLLEEVRSLLRPWDWIEIAVTIALISLFVLSFILS